MLQNDNPHEVIYNLYEETKAELDKANGIIKNFVKLDRVDKLHKDFHRQRLEAFKYLYGHKIPTDVDAIMKAAWGE